MVCFHYYSFTFFIWAEAFAFIAQTAGFRILFSSIITIFYPTRRDEQAAKGKSWYFRCFRRLLIYNSTLIVKCLYFDRKKLYKWWYIILYSAGFSILSSWFCCLFMLKILCHLIVQLHSGRDFFSNKLFLSFDIFSTATAAEAESSPMMKKVTLNLEAFPFKFSLKHSPGLDRYTLYFMEEL